MALPRPVRAALRVPTASCPVAAVVCDVAADIAQRLQRGDASDLLEVADAQPYFCPGPVAGGLGGPYPLCAGSTPGEVRQGFPVVHLQSEGDVLAQADFTSTLQRTLDAGAQGYSLASIGCPGVGSDAASTCGDQFVLVFSDGVARPVVGGQSFAWSVLALQVQRTEHGTLAIGGAGVGPLLDSAVPVELAGGEALAGSLLIQDFGPGTFFVWTPAAD